MLVVTDTNGSLITSTIQSFNLQSHLLVQLQILKTLLRGSMAFLKQKCLLHCLCFALEHWPWAGEMVLALHMVCLCLIPGSTYGPLSASQELSLSTKPEVCSLLPKQNKTKQNKNSGLKLKFWTGPGWFLQGLNLKTHPLYTKSCLIHQIKKFSVIVESTEKRYFAGLRATAGCAQNSFLALSSCLLVVLRELYEVLENKPALAMYEARMLTPILSFWLLKRFLSGVYACMLWKFQVFDK